MHRRAKERTILEFICVTKISIINLLKTPFPLFFSFQVTEQSADVVSHYGHFIKNTQRGCYSWHTEGMKTPTILLQAQCCPPSAAWPITIGFPVPRQAERSYPGNSSSVCRGNPSMQLVLAVFALVHANVSRDALKARGSSSFHSKRLWVSPYINGDFLHV